MYFNTKLAIKPYSYYYVSKNNFKKNKKVS